MNWQSWMVWSDLSLLYWVRPSGLHLWRALAFSVTTSSQKSVCPAVITLQVCLQGANKCISGCQPMDWCVMSSVNESFRDSRQHHHTAAVIHTCAGLAPKPLTINGKDCTLFTWHRREVWGRAVKWLHTKVSWCENCRKIANYLLSCQYKGWLYITFSSLVALSLTSFKVISFLL